MPEIAAPAATPALVTLLGMPAEDDGNGGKGGVGFEILDVGPSFPAPVGRTDRARPLFGRIFGEGGFADINGDRSPTPPVGRAGLARPLLESSLVVAGLSSGLVKPDHSP